MSVVCNFKLTYIFVSLQASDRELTWVMTIGIVGVGAAASVLANQVDSIYSLFVLCSYFVYVMLIQRNLQHMVHKTKKNKTKNITQYVLDTTLRKQTQIPPNNWR
jgi:nitrate reductase gamma subunit